MSDDADDPDTVSTAGTDAGDDSASRAYLDTISVQGFRGIGAACDLRITPGAGLTLVVGRNDDGLPPGAAARAVPLFCRLAMEAACTEVVRRRRIGRGEPHAATDEVLNDARTLMHKLALALFDDSGRTGGVLARINRADRAWADAVTWANRGTHGAEDAFVDVPSVVGSTERLTRWLGNRQ